MASSRKRRSDKNGQERSRASFDGSKNDKKSSSRGCLGRRSKKRRNNEDRIKYTESVDRDDRPNFSGSSQHIEANSSSYGNKYNQQDTSEVFGQNSKRKMSIIDHDCNIDSHFPPMVDPARNVNLPRNSYQYQGSSSKNVTIGDELKNNYRNPSNEVDEVFERTIITRNADDKKGNNTNSNAVSGNQPHGRTVTHAQVERRRRPSIISRVTSSFSSGSSYRKKATKAVQSKAGIATNQGNFNSSKVVIKDPSEKASHTTVKKAVVSMDQTNVTSNDKGSIPVLKTNKSYKISFAMSRKDLYEKESSERQDDYITTESVYKKSANELKRKRSSKRIQTEEGYFSDRGHKHFDNLSVLMRDVHIDDRYLSQTADGSGGLKSVSATTNTGPDQNHSGAAESYRVRNTVSANANGAREQNYSYSDQAWSVRNNADKGQVQMVYNNSQGGNPRNNTSGVAYNGQDATDAIYAAEGSVYKEWFLIENSEGKQEKREYRREIAADGDTNYIDVIDGKILKTEKAEWKSGEEFIKDKNGTKKVRYEWRKDMGTNEWTKYDSDTNEIMRRGDWKSGSEWTRNSKGKFIESHYTYKKGPDGRWIKYGTNSGTVIDYSNCTALRGHNWVSNKKSGKGKRWRKQDYEYIQNGKGKWVKQDPVTHKRLEKPSKMGWKEGKVYSMDKNNKIKKTKYIWETDSNGMMERVNKRTKEPINTSWMQGREVIMNNNKVVSNNYTWVKNGRNTWVKIDELGKPLTKSIKTNKISSYHQSSTPNQAYVSKTTQRVENDKVVEENIKLEQKDGMVVRNTTKTVRY